MMGGARVVAAEGGGMRKGWLWAAAGPKALAGCAAGGRCADAGGGGRDEGLQADFTGLGRDENWAETEAVAGCGVGLERELVFLFLILFPF
jgi:hypothetical protein